MNIIMYIHFLAITIFSTTSVNVVVAVKSCKLTPCLVRHGTKSKSLGRVFEDDVVERLHCRVSPAIHRYLDQT